MTVLHWQAGRTLKFSSSFEGRFLFLILAILAVFGIDLQMTNLLGFDDQHAFVKKSGKLKPFQTNAIIFFEYKRQNI